MPKLNYLKLAPRLTDLQVAWLLYLHDYEYYCANSIFPVMTPDSKTRILFIDMNETIKLIKMRKEREFYMEDDLKKLKKLLEEELKTAREID